MKPCTLYIVRHGQSVHNQDNVCGGHLDAPLTKLGKQQAENTKQLLAGIHFDDIYSSDLQRAYKTIEIICGKPVPPDHQLADLRERNFGKLEGQPVQLWLELNKKYDEQYGALPLEERWKHSYADYIEGNGPLIKRFLQALRDISCAHPGETILVGAHGGCVRATLVKLGYANEPDLPPGSFSNSAYIVLVFDGQKFKITQVTCITTTPQSGAE